MSDLVERKRLFIAGMAALADAFDISLRDARVAVYWSVLGRYETSALKKALQEALENESRFPSVADIRKYIEPLLDPRHPPTSYKVLG